MLVCYPQKCQAPSDFIIIIICHFWVHSLYIYSGNRPQHNVYWWFWSLTGACTQSIYILWVQAPGPCILAIFLTERGLYPEYIYRMLILLRVQAPAPCILTTFYHWAGPVLRVYIGNTAWPPFFSNLNFFKASGEGKPLPENGFLRGVTR